MKGRSDVDSITSLIGDIARAMVDLPEFVRVDVVAGSAIRILEVSVASNDLGKLVGRGGRSAAAIRRLLLAIGGKMGMKLTLEILEPNGEDRQTEVIHRRAKSTGTVMRPPLGRDFDTDPVGTTGNLIERVARELVDHADRVRLNTLAGAQAAVYEIHLDQRDVPRFLGRGGRTIGAIREILWNLGRKAGRHFVVEVVEPVEKVG